MHDINNSVETLHRLHNLLNNAELSDVRLIVGNNSFYAHKLILSMSSDVLKAMLTNPAWPEFYQNEVVLVEDSRCEVVFGEFLKYLYSGIVYLRQDIVLPLLKLADKYAVTDLANACVEFMKSTCESGLSVEYVWKWFHYGQLNGNHQLISSCRTFICNNFEMAVQTEYFVNVHHNVLIEVLRSPDLVVNDELTVYTAAKKWLKPKLDTKHYYLIMHSIMKHIRFPMFDMRKLLQVNTDVLQLLHQGIPNSKFLQEPLYEAELFNRLPFTERRLSHNHDKFLPRNYTNEEWTTFLIIDDFKNFTPYTTRAMFFPTPISGSDADNTESWEWNVELYPKGVHFDQSIMIGLQESLTVPSTHYQTTRLSVKSSDSDQKRVQISVFTVARSVNNVEYVKTMKSLKCVFDGDNNFYNIDDILPYDKLNSDNLAVSTQYLTGVDLNTLKIGIIIKPLR